MIRRLLATASLAAAALPAPAPAAAQQMPAFTELNPPLPTDTKGRIEVVEFFWYECPHCYALEPYLEAWVKKLPKDVEFRRVPATFNDRWNISARVYYALEAMGLIDKLHRPLMDAIHKDRLRITDERQLTRLAAAPRASTSPSSPRRSSRSRSRAGSSARRAWCRGRRSTACRR